MQLSRTKFRKSFILSTKKWIKCFPGKILSIQGKNLEISHAACHCCQTDFARLGPCGRLVLTPAGSSQQIRREICQRAASICLLRATCCCPPGLGDTGRPGRAAGTRMNVVLPAAGRPVSAQIRFSNRPLAGQEIQIIAFRSKSKIFLPLCIHPSRPSSVDHPPAQPHRYASPLRACTCRSQAAVTLPQSQAPLCPATIFASSISLLNW